MKKTLKKKERKGDEDEVRATELDTCTKVNDHQGKLTLNTKQTKSNDR